MTCGYLNSAGTDLDSVFHVQNGNHGAVGFLASDGRDLGNRFTGETTLGYAVGYTNSAGTDLGYLRGANTVPTVASWSVGYTQQQADWGGGRRVSGNFKFVQKLNNVGSGLVGHRIKVSFLIPGYKNSYWYTWAWKANTTENIWNAQTSGSNAYPNQETSPILIYDAWHAASSTINISMFCRFGTNGSGSTESPQRVVFYHEFYNSFGQLVDTTNLRKVISIGI